MMTTNLLATILTVLATNTVTHWPKVWKWEPVEHTEYLNIIPGTTYQPGPGGMLQPGLQQWRDDTNANLMSSETTVTCQRLLSFEFESRKFSEVLTNEPWMHYSVEMQSVRTNVWIDPTPGDMPGFYVVPQSLSMRTRGIDLNPQFLVETNYFVPVKTNTLPLVPEEIGAIGTNMFYILNNVATNYTVLWAVTNATNTTK